MAVGCLATVVVVVTANESDSTVTIVTAMVCELTLCTKDADGGRVGDVSNCVSLSA